MPRGRCWSRAWPSANASWVRTTPSLPTACTTSATCFGATATTTPGNGSSSAPSPSARGTTPRAPTSRPRSTAWAPSPTGEATTPRPAACGSGRWPSARGPSAPTIRLVAQTLNNLAIVHTFTNDPAGARPLLERAIAVQQKVLGPKHPDLASGLMNLGDVLSAWATTPRPGPTTSGRWRSSKRRAPEPRAGPVPRPPRPAAPEAGRHRRGAAPLRRSLALREKALGPATTKWRTAWPASATALATRAARRRWRRSTARRRALPPADGGYYRGPRRPRRLLCRPPRDGTEGARRQMEGLGARLRKPGPDEPPRRPLPRGRESGPQCRLGLRAPVPAVEPTKTDV